MVSKTFIIKNPTGIHLKPAAALCNEAIKYQCAIKLVSGTTTTNAKSVLNVLSACVRFNDEISLICDGPDEQQALDNIGSLIQKGLGEKV